MAPLPFSHQRGEDQGADKRGSTGSLEGGASLSIFPLPIPNRLTEQSKNQFMWSPVVAVSPTVHNKVEETDAL